MLRRGGCQRWHAAALVPVGVPVSELRNDLPVLEPDHSGGVMRVELVLHAIEDEKFSTAREARVLPWEPVLLGEGMRMQSAPVLIERPDPERGIPAPEEAVPLCGEHWRAAGAPHS